MSDKPRFIRRNGRIIPIGKKTGTKSGNAPKSYQNGGKISAKSTKPTKMSEKAKGAGFIASGLGLSALSGFAAGKLFKSAAKTGKEAKKMTKTAAFALGASGHTSSLGQKAGEILLRGAGRRAKTMNKKLAASKAVFKFGSNVIGASLIGVGISNFVEKPGKQNSDAVEFGSTIAGYGTLLFANKAFKKALGNKLIRKLVKGKL